MEKFLAGPATFLDAALSSIEAELLPIAAPDSLAGSQVAELKRAAQVWARVDLPAERLRWAQEESAPAALLRLRTLLRDVPDPAAALSAALEASALASEAADLARAELAAVREASQQAADASGDAAAAGAAQELAAASSALAVAQEAMRSERAARDAAERAGFAAAERTSASQAAHAQELETLSAEAERAAQRAREAEAEAARARGALAASTSGSGAATSAALAEQVAELGASLAVKERASSRLSSELAGALRECEAARVEAAAARQDAGTHMSAASRLRVELERRPTVKEVEALRRELAALQAVCHVAEAGPVAAAAAAAASPAEAAAEALPAALAGARRRAQACEEAMATQRSELAASRAEALQANVLAAEAERAQVAAAALAQRLEADLQAACPAEAPGASTGCGDGEALLAVVCGQRERLRARVTHLEDEAAACAALLSAARSACASSAEEVQRLRAQARRLEGLDAAPRDAEEGGLGTRMRRRVSKLGCFGGARNAAAESKPAYEDALLGGGPTLQGGSHSGSLVARSLALAYVTLLHLLLVRVSVAKAMQ